MHLKFPSPEVTASGAVGSLVCQPRGGLAQGHTPSRGFLQMQGLLGLLQGGGEWGWGGRVGVGRSAQARRMFSKRSFPG